VGRQDWETPNELFAIINNEYQFTLDAAAENHNAKCERYIDEAEDALTVHDLVGEKIWCNPPYFDMFPWARQFIRWSKENLVVVLAQDKTDTRWFRDMFNASYKVRFLYGRVVFRNTWTTNRNGAVLFVMGDIYKGLPRMVDVWDWRREL